MQSLGLDVLFKGSNFLRLLEGLWVAVRISLISVVLSIVLGIPAGMLMTSRSRVIRAVFRVYLEIVRIMPQISERPGCLAGIFQRKRLPSSSLCSGAVRRWGIW